MSAELVDVSNGCVTVRFSGTLTREQWLALQQEVAVIFVPNAKVRILALVEDFEGWEKSGAWGDISFQLQYDPQIERMAIVCDAKWEGLALLFASKGFRKFPIEHFPLPDLDKARAWLTQDIPPAPPVNPRPESHA